jgi:hypothetical protein
VLLHPPLPLQAHRLLCAADGRQYRHAARGMEAKGSDIWPGPMQLRTQWAPTAGAALFSQQRGPINSLELRPPLSLVRVLAEMR